MNLRIMLLDLWSVCKIYHCSWWKMQNKILTYSFRYHGNYITYFIHGKWRVIRSSCLLLLILEYLCNVTETCFPYTKIIGFLCYSLSSVYKLYYSLFHKILANTYDTWVWVYKWWWWWWSWSCLFLLFFPLYGLTMFVCTIQLNLIFNDTYDTWVWVYIWWWWSRSCLFCCYSLHIASLWRFVPYDSPGTLRIQSSNAYKITELTTYAPLHPPTTKFYFSRSTSQGMELD